MKKMKYKIYPERNQRIVIALGGNAIDPVSKKEKGGKENRDQKPLENFCRSIADIVKQGKQIIITHGNGPQVGNLFLQQEIAKEYVNPLSLNICVALSQAQIGTALKQRFANIFESKNIKKTIVPILTNVAVDPSDPAFKNPTKPIGPAYTEREAKKMEKTGMKIKRTPEGIYKRVVASPHPKKILEIEIIKKLLKDNVLVIAAGGGGIPMVKMKNSLFKPVDAVIDKDLSSALLAKEIKAEELIILTNINYVCLNYRKLNERKIKRLTAAEAIKYLKEGQFPAGSMGPKIEAAINFLKNGGKKVVIGHLAKTEKILKGQSGTIIEK